jgi:hypothetical protein
MANDLFHPLDIHDRDIDQTGLIPALRAERNRFNPRTTRRRQKRLLLLRFGPRVWFPTDPLCTERIFPSIFTPYLAFLLRIAG